VHEAKQAFNESGWANRPAKATFALCFATLIPAFINLITLALLFPFAWSSLALDVLALLLAIYLLKLIFKSKKSWVASVRWWIVAIIMLFWASICPFVVAPKPIYLAILESDNPFSSKMLPLDNGGQSIGSVMLVTDLLRKHIAPLLKRHYPKQIRLLNRSEYANSTYYNLPALDTFIVDTPEPGEVIWKRSIYFPLDALFRGVGLQLTKRFPLDLRSQRTTGTIELSIGTHRECLLNFAYTQYRDTVPWNAVLVQSNQEESALTYVALLDSALQCFATGKTEQAVRMLENAARVVPESNLEAARLATLQYIVVRAFLGGNIGQLQSLPLLHRAYKVFDESTTDPRFSKRDPLINWLRNTLLGGYQDYAASGTFFDRIAKLKELPHVDDDQKSHFDILETNLKSHSPKALMALLKSQHYSAAELHFIKDMVYGSFTIESIGRISRVVSASTNLPQISLTENDEDLLMTEKLAAMSVGAKDALPIIQYIDSLLSHRTEVETDPYAREFLEAIRDDFPRMLEHLPLVDDLVGQQRSNSEVISDWRQLFTWIQTGSNVQAYAIGQQCEWWKMDYFYWFASWMQAAIVGIDQHNNPWKLSSDYPPVQFDFRTEMSQRGISCFVNDRNGSGEAFLPGLFCLTWYTKTMGLTEHQALEQQFEADTLMTFDTFLSGLYSAN
jgi:hypothetical protein